MILLETTTTIGLSVGEIISLITAVGAIVSIYFVNRSDVAKINVEIVNMKQQQKETKDDLVDLTKKVDGNMDDVRDEINDVAIANKQDHKEIMDKIEKNHNIIINILLGSKND